MITYIKYTELRSKNTTQNRDKLSYHMRVIKKKKKEERRT